MMAHREALEKAIKWATHGEKSTQPYEHQHVEAAIAQAWALIAREIREGGHG